MAKRRGHKSKTRVVYRRSPTVTRTTVAKPIVIRAAAPAVHHKRRRHHSGGGGGGGGDLLNKENMALATGAVALGWIDKQQMFQKWTIPGIGRAGTIAIGAHYANKHFKLPLLGKISKAAIVIALYELGNKGQIAGVDVI